jgi:UDP-N-acetylglucosamine 4,6-dehydratase
MKSGANRIVVLSRDELKQSDMRNEFSGDRVRYFLGDVRDRDRLRTAFQGIDYVIHAAALKQIPAGEYNPSEFILTNVIGTQNVLSVAAEVGVKRVLVLSSDKASAPVTLYGSTKSLAEHLVRAGQHYNPNGTKFACVRYGNVAGSRGSVIPLWRAMLQRGERILPITDGRMTRFFFRIEEAVDLALWALENMSPGGLYVPRMPSFYVTDLAKAMGAKDIKLVGIRGIEKLHETMICKDEAPYFRDYGSRFARLSGDDDGHSLPDGYEYSSDMNGEWLSIPKLVDLVSETQAIAA